MSTDGLLLDVHQLGKVLGLGRETIRRHVADGALPKPIRIGGARRWSRTAIELWIAEQSKRANGVKGGNV